MISTGKWDTMTRYADISGTSSVGTRANTYDQAGRLTGLSHSPTSEHIEIDYTWSYDKANRITGHHELRVLR